jgi:hypothetical protein
VTATLSVEAVHERLMADDEMAVAERLVGAEGGVVSNDWLAGLKAASIIWESKVWPMVHDTVSGLVELYTPQAKAALGLPLLRFSITVKPWSGLTLSAPYEFSAMPETIRSPETDGVIAGRGAGSKPVLALWSVPLSKQLVVAVPLKAAIVIKDESG